MSDLKPEWVKVPVDITENPNDVYELNINKMSRLMLELPNRHSDLKYPRVSLCNSEQSNNLLLMAEIKSCDPYDTETVKQEALMYMSRKLQQLAKGCITLSIAVQDIAYTERNDIDRGV